MKTRQQNIFNLPTSTLSAWLPCGCDAVAAIDNVVSTIWNSHFMYGISKLRQVEIRDSKHIAIDLKSKA